MEQIHKARFVLKGHTNFENKMIVHNSTNLKQQRVRLIVSMAAIFGFTVWAQVVSQAYSQSKTLSARDVYVKPKGRKRKRGQTIETT